MVVNIVVAFILDAFLFRIASQQDGDKSGLEGDSSQVEVKLTQEECSGPGGTNGNLHLMASPVSSYLLV